MVLCEQPGQSIATRSTCIRRFSNGSRWCGRAIALRRSRRQSRPIGSTRLISASPGLNVKRSFDGASLSYRASRWTVVGVAARLVALSSGAFDDAWNAGQRFWGAAAGGRSPRFERGEARVNNLGTSHPATSYFQGSGDERRYTVGTKWSGTGRRFDLNYDGIFRGARLPARRSARGASQLKPAIVCRLSAGGRA